MSAMRRIVVRPRIQIPILVVIFTVWALLGVTFFTSGDVVSKRDWFGIVMGFVLMTSGVAGVWRAVRLGVVIDRQGVRVRGFDSRDSVTRWSEVQSIDCEQVDVRGGLPLFAPVLSLGEGSSLLPMPVLGSYSRQDAERKVAQLRRLKASAASTMREGEGQGERAAP